ncbi:unnamed protein product [Candida verbasci]|uniref:non-specific serine/threonine protein kinase n=1 Tax=Candida verbasci TaxID=1227364 RepID=A0A9W4TWH7_9ASCO|nr:unnamed protein product [Candida verbasci]
MNGTGVINPSNINNETNINGKYINDQNYTAKLAAQYNEFYLNITSPKINQIGNYKIIKEIGEGSFGKVYLATHIILNINVVLKCGLIDDPNIVREIYYHKQLKMKNIVSLYEVIKTENHLWIVMEYCQGGELYYHIYEKKRLTLAECKPIFFQIVLGVKYVHSLNLSHRDLKLENILLADQKKSIVKLTDFGFIREFNPQSRKFLSTICGTTVYMAPELISQSKYSGFQIDIWSLGIILYTMLYGVLPFDDDDEMIVKNKILTIDPEFAEIVPNDVNLLINKMLNKDPNLRPNLNEILNSSFLIDIYNKHLEKERKEKFKKQYDVNDSESILSINQHYNTIKQPFSTKIEKDLIKKLQRLDLNIEELQESVYNNEMNSLTAFYELLLTQEFTKKKKKYIKEKKRKYYEAKHSLKRSKKRVKSALSLSSDPSLTGSQPLERIFSTLSITSNKNSSKTNLTKYASNTTNRKSLDHHPQSLQLPNQNIPKSPTNRLSVEPKFSSLKSHSRKSSQVISPTSSNPQSNINGNGVSLSSVPLQRAVSFVPDERRLSNASSNKEFTRRNNKSGKILNKLQFWKKTKYNTDSMTIDDEDSTSHHSNVTSNGKATTNNINNDYDVADPLELQIKRSVPEQEQNQLQSEKKSTNDQQSTILFEPNFRRTNLSPNDTNVQDSRLLIPNDTNIQDSRLLIPNGTESPSTPPSSDNKLTRTRPSSMISQFSQFSRLSQMSTMLSESELDILDETDTMDDDDDDDDAYESSINTSQDNSKLPSATGMTPTSSNVINHRHKKRPSYKRALSSDVSIQTNSSSNYSMSIANTNNNKKKTSITKLVDYLNANEKNGPIDPTSNLPSILNNESEKFPYQRAPSPPVGFKFGNKPQKKISISMFSYNNSNHGPTTVFPKSYQDTKQVEEWLNNGTTNSTTTTNKNTTYEPVINEEDEDE